MGFQDSRLDELRTRWEQLRRNGQFVSAAELCGDCPELLEMLEERLRAMPAPGSASATEIGNAAETESPAPGTTRAFQVSEYEILGELGKGGMGVVYRAYDRKRGEIVALKTMPWLDSSSLHRFKREFRALADLAHPNLVTLHELVSDGRNWFFTMELVEGADFLTYVRTVRGSSSRGDCSPALLATKLARLRNAMSQLAEGIVALHEAGKLHRDIKPSNVLVTNQGRVVLLDFGLVAEMEQTGLHESTEAHVLGTFAFMSPEQAASQPVSSAADWYSVGVMLYQALTGRLPYQGSPLEILAAKQGAEPPPPHALVPGVPEDLDQLCAELLRKEPGRRPAGRQVLERLGSVSHGPMTPAPALCRTSGTVSLVGRERHLDFLRDAFAAMVRGKAVVVHVHGRSGQGKTSLVECFLDELLKRDEAVVLAGRCYERESVPYKALDSLIDSLARYLRRLPAQEAQVLLPRDVSSLSRLFPVLQSVEAVSSLPQRSVEVPDPLEMRRRAFIALRDLLARLGDRRPLVLFIDDLHWGDVDSAALLSELLRPPDPPVFLLLGSYRSEDEATSPFLREFIGASTGTHGPIDRRELAVEALTPTEAEALATCLLDSSDPVARAHAEVIARESGGNPFFVYELARHLRTDASLAERFAARGQITLERVLRTRIEQLTSDARRLLEVVAVSGRPLGQFDAFRAAELHAEGWTALTALRSGRLIRMTASGEQDLLDTYHDRIRESVVAHLEPRALESHHRLLARVMEGSGCADPEILAVHFRGAKMPDRAGEYYAKAAEQAAAALAFDRAAELYGIALELRPIDDAEGRQLRSSRGDALANAGRGLEAAREYLAASAGAGPRVELERKRRAATQLLISGHVDEGLTALQDVLRRMGMALPSTPGKALAALLLRRALLRLRGLGFRLRDESKVSAEDLTRIDLCWTVAVGLMFIDFIQGASFQTLGLLLALRSGEPYRITRAIAIEAVYLSSSGGPSQPRVSQLLSVAEPLAEFLNNPHAKAMTMFARAAATVFSGEWRAGRGWLEGAEEILRSRCSGVTWDLDIVNYAALWNLTYLGEVNQLRRRLPSLVKEARERGDLLAEASLSTHMSMVCLADHNPAEAESQLTDAVSKWTGKGFNTLHGVSLRARVQILLYRGEIAAVCKLVATAWPFLKRSMLLRMQITRIQWLEFRARCALAAAVHSPNPAPLLRAAECDARRLDRERRPWASAYAQFIRGGIALRRGDAAKAEELLTKAAASFEAVDMNLCAAVTRRRLGELMGGDRGRALVEEADRWMMMQQIQNPAQWAAMYSPGFSA
jgi:serine/threonine protein kinase